MSELDQLVLGAAVGLGVCFLGLITLALQNIARTIRKWKP